jgi:general transcription factor 3C polypeptide 5 (transcription factor C subunit 1)
LRTYVIPEEKADYIVASGEAAETDMDVDVNIDPQLMEPSGYQSTSNPPMKSNLRLFPPPLFSRQTIPQGYKFVLFFLSDYCEVISGYQFQVQQCVDGINYC